MSEMAVMASIDWDPVVTLAAVIVGGALSTLGGLWARRRDIRLERRARLRDQLAVVRRELGDGYPRAQVPSHLSLEQFDAISRVTFQGVIIGRAEYDLTMKIVKPVAQMRLLRNAGANPAPHEWHVELADALSALTLHLTHKLGPRRTRRLKDV